MDDTCAICGNYPETTLRALRDYIVSKQKSYGRALEMVSLRTLFFFQLPLSNWLDLNITRQFKGIEWPLLFSTACCSLWYSRNWTILENKTNAYHLLDCKVKLLAT